MLGGGVMSALSAALLVWLSRHGFDDVPRVVVLLLALPFVVCYLGFVYAVRGERMDELQERHPRAMVAVFLVPFTLLMLGLLLFIASAGMA